jgi:hypothetical protein
MEVIDNDAEINAEISDVVIRDVNEWVNIRSVAMATKSV